jgi:hypothetical protein
MENPVADANFHFLPMEKGCSRPGAARREACVTVAETSIPRMKSDYFNTDANRGAGYGSRHAALIGEQK